MQLTARLRLFVLLLLVVSCKPKQELALLAESGGSEASWRARPTLTSNGAINVLSTAPTDTNIQLSRVALKIEGAPDASVPASSLRSREWMPLTSGSATLSITMLMTVGKGDTCYINNVRLGGQEQSVACKSGTQPNGNSGGGGTPNPATDIPTSPAMAEACRDAGGFALNNQCLCEEGRTVSDPSILTTGSCDAPSIARVCKATNGRLIEGDTGCECDGTKRYALSAIPAEMCKRP